MRLRVLLQLLAAAFLSLVGPDTRLDAADLHNVLVDFTLTPLRISAAE
jgi:hypothetical protein